MKLFKKVLAVSTVLALTFSAVPVSAATDTYDFEDGNVPATIAMKTDDGGDVSLLSVVDYDGSKQLFVDVQDYTKVPKLQFDVLAAVGAENLDKVRKITFDLTVVSDDGTTPLQWQGGGDGAGTGADGKTWYNDPTQWSINEAESATSKLAFTFAFVDGMGFTKDATASSFLFMKWGCSAPNANGEMYIDNVKFLDADGNALAIAGGEAADTAASTDVPKTGVVGFAVLYGLGAVATGAVALKRKNK